MTDLLTSKAHPTEPQCVQVLVVEDDPQTRAFFVQAVQQSSALQLCGEAASVAQGRALLLAMKQAGQSPDVLLTDLGLPDGSGLELIRWVAAEFVGCDSLVISMFGDEDHVLSSIEAGATGYLHKDSAPADIAASILQLKSGASPISPMIARRLLAKYQQLGHASTAVQQENAPIQPLAPLNIGLFATNNVANGAVQCSTTKPGLPDGMRMLSPRETDILEHIGRGFSYAEVARLKHVSVHTVQTHIKNIYAKLSVHNRSEAVYEATRLGLIAP
jgi:DNA-binding NarL/FixJ family response regulator